MCDKERLIGYLYDELPSSERKTFERHLASCAECREEVSQLGATRVHLASWVLPESNLDFAVVPRRAPSTSRWFRVSPSWGLAAAAVLLLAVASAIANVEVRAGSGGVVIRTGWARASSTHQATAAAPAAQFESASGPSPQHAGVRVGDPRLENLEKRLSEMEASVAARPAALALPANADTQRASADMLRQVRQLLQQSETRQQQELAMRIQQVVLEFNRARMSDFSRMQSAVAQLQGRTDTALTNQLAMEKALIRTVQQDR